MIEKLQVDCEFPDPKHIKVLAWRMILSTFDDIIQFLWISNGMTELPCKWCKLTIIEWDLWPELNKNSKERIRIIKIKKSEKGGKKVKGSALQLLYSEKVA